MKKLFIGALAISLLFSSCGDSNNSSEEANSTAELVAKGGKNYGGVLKVNENEYFKNLFPHSVIDAFSDRIANQVYEGLFSFDQENLSTINKLCSEYTVR